MKAEMTAELMDERRAVKMVGSMAGWLVGMKD